MKELLSRLNHTELYQMARSAGIVVSPATRNEDLILYLTEEVEPPKVPHEVDRWRYGIMGFLLSYWQIVETQLTCPAKTKDPRACFNCVDQQVVACLVQNKDSVELIQVHRKDHLGETI